MVMLFALSRHSSASQQRRWNAKPPKPLKDRCKKFSWNPYLRHLEWYVIGVTDNLPPNPNPLHSELVLEMPGARENHRNLALITGCDRLGVPFGTARLNDGLHARLDQ